MKKNQLKFADIYTLVEFVKKNKEVIEKDRMTVPEMAKFCSTNLPFEVTAGNMRTVFEALGDDAPAKPKRGPSTTGRESREFQRRNRAAIRELIRTLGDAHLEARIDAIFNGRLVEGDEE